MHSRRWPLSTNASSASSNAVFSAASPKRRPPLLSRSPRAPCDATGSRPRHGSSAPSRNENVAATRWSTIATILDAALDRDAKERARYLDESCAGDAALRAEAEALLADGLAPSFLDSGALIFAAPLLEAVPNEVRTESGGTYTLERELGRGGMATV